CQRAVLYHLGPKSILLELRATLQVRFMLNGYYLEGGLMKSIYCKRLMLGAMMLGVTALAATTINYRLANTYKFGAAPGDREYFDYITFDPDSRRLYLSHGSEVLVVNADTGKEEGKISGLKQSH